MSKLAAPTYLFEWDDALGRGFYPVDNPTYDDSYFDKYSGYEKTKLGKTITRFRKNLVLAFTEGRVLDVGIGSGSFIKAHGNSDGIDVCQKAIDWLNRKEVSYRKDKKYSALTFFDSLEHLAYPEVIIEEVNPKYIFVSIPIFTSREHALQSKHFRPDEHYHYFTKEGFVGFMDDLGYRTILASDAETLFGREDILTFVCVHD